MNHIAHYRTTRKSSKMNNARHSLKMNHLNISTYPYLYCYC